MKRLVKALLRRIFGPLFFALLLGATAGCAIGVRTVGMHDPIIDVVQALAASQTATVKALTDALSQKPCRVEPASGPGSTTLPLLYPDPGSFYSGVTTGPSKDFGITSQGLVVLPTPSPEVK